MNLFFKSKEKYFPGNFYNVILVYFLVFAILFFKFGENIFNLIIFCSAYVMAIIVPGFFICFVLKLNKIIDKLDLILLVNALGIIFLFIFLSISEYLLPYYLIPKFYFLIIFLMFILILKYFKTDLCFFVNKFKDIKINPFIILTLLLFNLLLIFNNFSSLQLYREGIKFYGKFSVDFMFYSGIIEELSRKPPHQLHLAAGLTLHYQLLAFYVAAFLKKITGFESEKIIIHYIPFIISNVYFWTVIIVLKRIMNLKIAILFIWISIISADLFYPLQVVLNFFGVNVFLPYSSAANRFFPGDAIGTYDAFIFFFLGLLSLYYFYKSHQKLLLFIVGILWGTVFYIKVVMFFPIFVSVFILAIINLAKEKIYILVFMVLLFLIMPGILANKDKTNIITIEPFSIAKYYFRYSPSFGSLVLLRTKKEKTGINKNKVPLRNYNKKNFQIPLILKKLLKNKIVLTLIYLIISFVLITGHLGFKIIGLFSMATCYKPKKEYLKILVVIPAISFILYNFTFFKYIVASTYLLSFFELIMIIFTAKYLVMAVSQKRYILVILLILVFNFSFWERSNYIYNNFTNKHLYFLLDSQKQAVFSFIKNNTEKNAVIMHPFKSFEVTYPNSKRGVEPVFFLFSGLGHRRVYLEGERNIKLIGIAPDEIINKRINNVENVYNKWNAKEIFNFINKEKINYLIWDAKKHLPAKINSYFSIVFKNSYALILKPKTNV